MKNLRFAIFGVILAGGVALAVSSLFAQTGEPLGRARIMALDSRGSQIGVMVQDLTADDLKGAVINGVRVDEVDQDSPAAKAGLREGDIVVEFDGERVRSARQFSRLVQETVSGRTVKLGIVRGGEKQSVDVTPDSRAMAWGVDGDRIGRDIARSFRDLEPKLREIEPKLREIEPRFRELEPRLREFGSNPPGFNFDFREMLPLTPRGRLGVQLESMSPQLADYFGAKDGGVLVSSVTTGSAAEKAGLKAGDVIVSIDGDRVRDYDDVMSELRNKTGEVTIGIVRDKKETTLKATLEERPRRLQRSRRPA